MSSCRPEFTEGSSDLLTLAREGKKAYSQLFESAHRLLILAVGHLVFELLMRLRA
jgi:hypothetical protein